MDRLERTAAMAIVPPERFGVNHENMLVYLEHVAVSLRGYPNPSGLRCAPEHAAIFGLMWANLELPDMRWKREYSTTLRDGTLLDGHDDWDCLNDLAAAGLVEIVSRGPVRIRMTDAGWERAHALRRARATRELRS